MKGDIVSVHNIVSCLTEETKEAFINQIMERIEDIEAKKHYAEIHYSTCAINGQVVQCALIVERER